jgi:hypothetical protein
MKVLVNGPYQGRESLGLHDVVMRYEWNDRRGVIVEHPGGWNPRDRMEFSITDTAYALYAAPGREHDRKQMWWFPIRQVHFAFSGDT